MEEKEIETAYNQFKRSLRQIKTAESRLIEESYSYSKWVQSLQDKSSLIRNNFVTDTMYLNEVVSKLEHDPSILTPELADMYITHVDFFMSEGYRDYQMTVPVLKALIPYFQQNGPKKRLFDCYCFLGIAVLENHMYHEANEYMTMGLSMYENPAEEIEEDYRKFRYICTCYFRMIAAITDPMRLEQEVVAYLKEMLDVWVNNPILDIFEKSRMQALVAVVRTTAATVLIRAMEGSSKKSFCEQSFQELYQFVCEEYQNEVEAFGSQLAVNDSIYTVYYKYQYKQGHISKQEYEEKLLEKYASQRLRFKDGENYTYGSMPFLTLFDDELPDEQFNVEKLSFMNHSFGYVFFLLPELQSFQINQEEILAQIQKYYAKMPVISGDYLVDYYIEWHLKHIFEHYNNSGMTLLLLHDICIKRQAMTVIHCRMVGRIAQLITAECIEKMPQFLVGGFGYETPEEVRRNREKIIENIYSAAQCHDLGKIICSDAINLQNRKIVDEEFELIKLHVKKGAEILNHIPTLRCYRDIAIGHHKYYDGTKGYPDEFDNTTSSIKSYIDIITIADCLDAATDTLGRNYTHPKTFNDVLLEMQQQKDTRYSGSLIDLISANEALCEKLAQLTGENRAMIYYEVFRTCVEPLGTGLRVHLSQRINTKVMEEKLWGRNNRRIFKRKSMCMQSQFQG